MRDPQACENTTASVLAQAFLRKETVLSIMRPYSCMFSICKWFEDSDDDFRSGCRNVSQCHHNRITPIQKIKDVNVFLDLQLLISS